MSYNYQCFEQTLCDDIIGSYTAYGIRNTADGNVINDVSSSREYTADIVTRLNKYQASPVHLSEIIADIIS